jgi:hypothetical protein
VVDTPFTYVPIPGTVSPAFFDTRSGPGGEVAFTLPGSRTPATLARDLDRLSLRFPEILLDESSRVVRAAVELSGQADRVDAANWKVVPFDDTEVAG